MVFSWGYEYILAKNVLVIMHPLSLVFYKYGLAFLFMFLIKLFKDRRNPIKKKHIPMYFLCALFGEVLYFAGEYGAINYLPVSIVTILLTFVPVLSILIEWALYKRKPRIGVVFGALVCIVGVSFVVGPDIAEIVSGAGIGYILASMSVISWNVYNFITERLTKSYLTFDLTLIQLGASALVCMPYALTHIPPISAFDSTIIFSILYLATIASMLGFVIYLNSLNSIGVTPTTLFSNMLPITTTFFGYIFLGEMIEPMQIIGGIVVVASGSVVIYLKGKELGGNT